MKIKETKEKYIIDEKGHKTAVVLDIELYNNLLEDLEDMKIIAERKKEPSMSLKEAENRLKKNGLI